MKRRIPWLLVSPAYLVIFAVCYAAILIYQRTVVGGAGIAMPEVELLFPPLYQIVLAAWMAAYGITRVWGFHPTVNRPYAVWLMATPWTCRQRLPLGPIHLVWQDLLVLAPVFLLERYHLHFPGPLPIIIFLVVYIGITAVFQFLTQPHPLALLLLAGLPVPLLLLNLPNWQWWALAELICLYPAAAYVTRASLRHFPWNIGTPKADSEVGNWLFARLGPVQMADKISVGAAFIISLFAAWWIFCITTQVEFPTARDDLLELRYFFIIAGGVVAVTRIATYCIYFRWPLSIPGRFATGRVIIPGYDKAFVAPLMSVVAACVVAMDFAGVRLPVVCALVAFFTLLPALALGPSLNRWKLTGFHRIANTLPGRGAARSNASLEMNFKFS